MQCTSKFVIKATVCAYSKFKEEIKIRKINEINNFINFKLAILVTVQFVPYNINIITRNEASKNKTFLKISTANLRKEKFVNGSLE